MAQRMARLLLVSLVSIVACACVAVSFARPTHWRPDDYPNPSTNASACGRDQPQVAGAWLCDPDRLITPTAAAGLADLLRHVSAGAKPFAQAPCGASAIEGFPVGVALMHRMYDSPDPAAAAAAFAAALLDAWALGDPACDNGLLLLVSALELGGVVAAEAGEGVRALLPGGVLDGVVRNATEEVREHRYAAAMENAVTHIGQELAAAVRPPPPPPPPPSSPSPQPQPGGGDGGGGSWWPHLPHLDLVVVLQALEEATLALCLVSGLVFGAHRIWRRLVRRHQAAAVAGARRGTCATRLREITRLAAAAATAPASHCHLCSVPLLLPGAASSPRQQQAQGCQQQLPRPAAAGVPPSPSPDHHPQQAAKPTDPLIELQTPGAGGGLLIHLDDQPAEITHSAAANPPPPPLQRSAASSASSAGARRGGGGGCGGPQPATSWPASLDGLQQPLLPAAHQHAADCCGASMTASTTHASAWEEDGISDAAAGAASEDDDGCGSRRHRPVDAALLCGGGGTSAPSLEAAVTLPCCGHVFCRPCAERTGLLPLPVFKGSGGGGGGGGTGDDQVLSTTATCCPACGEPAVVGLLGPPVAGGAGAAAAGRQRAVEAAGAGAVGGGCEQLLLQLRRLRAQYPELVAADMAAAWERDIRAGRPLDAHQLRRFRKAGGRSSGGWGVRSWLASCRDGLRAAVQLRSGLQQARQQRMLQRQQQGEAAMALDAGTAWV